ncbi:MAG TPA: MFS transporter [Vicinamibacterales bacterium]|nr:MFS transporter [Vicinamibacterales bacterium]
MSCRAVIALGIGQCVNWGVLYYAFAVLLLPVEAELGAERWIVTGAFSLALLLSAMAAPVVGRWSDRDRGARLMQVGGYAAAGLLGLWAMLPNVWVLYVVWAGLGLCMAATLYEPAFAVVGRAHDDPAARLRALGVVTLFGGLASTVFLPLTDAFVRIGGWRVGVLVLAVLLAVSTWMIHRIAFAGAREGPRHRPIVTRQLAPTDAMIPGPNLWFLLLAFGFASLSSAAVIANLVPTLAERAVTPTTAAAFGGMFGLMQLPGRALMMQGRFSASPFLLLAGSLGLQTLGLTTWALIPSVLAAFVGIALFAVGSGLTTLVRPYLVHTLFEGHETGYLNGRLAQAQQFARAAGPVLAGWAVTAVSYSAVLAVLGVAFAGLTVSCMFQAASRRAPGGVPEVLAVEERTPQVTRAWRRSPASFGPDRRLRR